MNKLHLGTFKPKLIIEIKCKHCGKIIITPKSENKLFCNSSCAASFNNKIPKRNKQIKPIVKKDIKINVEKRYANCNNILIKSSSKKFCSNKCQAELNWKNKKDEIILGNVTKSPTIKKFIIERDSYRCNICKLETWNNVKIPLVLDHINGDSTNNFPINLRLICPNCDALSEFYKNKNKGRGRQKRMERYHKGLTY